MYDPRVGRNVAIACVVIAACGRVGFGPEERVVDAPRAGVGDDAATPADAAGLPDAAHVLVDTTTVPTDGSTVHSKAMLEAGVSYIVLASGTFIFAGSNELADSEYFSINGSAGPKDIDTSNSLDFGVAIDTPNIGLAKTPAHWGAYNADSIYSTELVGSGATISVTLFDCCYSDNIGTLQLQIFK